MPDKRNSFIKGAMILTAATMVVKVVGMLYKIPLFNILGASGMSHFMTAYGIFNPVYALSVAGFPVAISKLVAESQAQRDYNECRKIFRCAMLLLAGIGIVGSAALFFCAGRAASLVDNPDARLSILAMAPAIFFCCILSVYRGYYQGLGNMGPTAVSQVLESVVRLVCGIAFAVLILRHAQNSYLLHGAVFGVAAANAAQAERLALPYAAAGAVLGVSASSAAGALYVFLRRLFGGDGISRAQAAKSAEPSTGGEILKALALTALPVCLGSVLTQITSFIDVITAMNRVDAAIASGAGIVINMYRGLIPADVTTAELPRYLYGAYGYCSSLFNLVPALTIPLGISALPALSSAWATGQRSAAGRQAQSVIKLSSLVAIPAGLGLCALARPILELLYPARIQEVAIAAPMMQSLAIAAALAGIMAPVSSVFQAVGRADIPVKLMAVGAGLKLLMNWFLLAEPRLNIHAAPYGTILCYLFLFAASLLFLQNVLYTPINVFATFVKPLICGIICALAAHTSYGLLSRLSSSRAVCLLSVVTGGIFYLFFVLFLRILTKNEILLLPGGKKVVKILEKLSLLG